MASPFRHVRNRKRLSRFRAVGLRPVFSVQSVCELVQESVKRGAHAAYPVEKFLAELVELASERVELVWKLAELLSRLPGFRSRHLIPLPGFTAFLWIGIEPGCL